MNHDEPKRAACAGMWDLFDSTNLADHAKAKKFCATCPVFVACDEQRKAEMRMGRTLLHNSGPRGTWAGRLVGKPVGRPGRGAVA